MIICDAGLPPRHAAAIIARVRGALFAAAIAAMLFFHAAAAIFIARRFTFDYAMR